MGETKPVAVPIVVCRCECSMLHEAMTPTATSDAPGLATLRRELFERAVMKPNLLFWSLRSLPFGVSCK